MPFRTFIKAKKIDMDAPADIGTRPIRSRIVKRICRDCIHYNASEKRCKFFKRIENPNWSYCSWYKEEL